MFTSSLNAPLCAVSYINTISENNVIEFEFETNTAVAASTANGFINLLFPTVKGTTQINDIALYTAQIYNS